MYPKVVSLMVNQLNRLLSGCGNDCGRVAPGVLSLFVVCLQYCRGSRGGRDASSDGALVRVFRKCNANLSLIRLFWKATEE